MGAGQRSLVLADLHFGDEDFGKLQSQFDCFADSIMVRSLSALDAALETFTFTTVVQLYRQNCDAVCPEVTLKHVQSHNTVLPFLVMGESLDKELVESLRAQGACCRIGAKPVNEDQKLSLDQLIAAAKRSDETSDQPDTRRIVSLDMERLFTVLGDGVLLVDPDLRIQAINPALQKMTGYGAEALSGTSALALDAGGLARHLRGSKQQQEEWRGDIQLRRQDGTVFPAQSIITPLQEKDGINEGFAVLISDISERVEHVNAIKRQASFDTLTGLPNRSLLQDRMVQILASVRRNKAGVAVLYVDLDHFKDANDTWGHAVGDAILIEAAQRMQACVRESDTVARIGGDEFVVVLTDLNEDHMAEKVAAKISGSLERPFVHEGAAIYISASIGIALSRLHGDTPEALFDNADAAMYEVKRNGRRGYRLYGDVAPVSEAVATSAHLGQIPIVAHEKPSLLLTLKEMISDTFVVNPRSLVPVCVASLSLLLVFGLLFATGTVGFVTSPEGDLITDYELNDFGTASGPEEDAITLDSLGSETK